MYNCKNSDRNPPDKRVSFFNFSSDAPLRKKWVEFVNRKNWNPVKNSKICSDHFRKDFINPRGPRLEEHAFPGCYRRDYVTNKSKEIFERVQFLVLYIGTIYALLWATTFF